MVVLVCFLAANALQEPGLACVQPAEFMCVTRSRSWITDHITRPSSVIGSLVRSSTFSLSLFMCRYCRCRSQSRRRRLCTSLTPWSATFRLPKLVRRGWGPNKVTSDPLPVALVGDGLFPAGAEGALSAGW